MWITVVPVSLFISFIWGATPISHKYIFNTFEDMTPEAMIVCGGVFYFLFSMIYFMFNRASVIRPVKELPWSVFLIMFCTASIGFLANYLYFQVIGKHASFLISALIFSSPIFTLILSYLFLKEDISIKAAIGVLLIVCGVVTLAISKDKVKPPGSVFRNSLKFNTTVKGD
jgi:drug/metabolite transporter (DMT)-like permease